MIKDFDSIQSVFLVGVGGVSMSGIAKYCLCLGKRVVGVDNESSFVTDELLSLGACVGVPDFPDKKVDTDVLVYSSAIDENNHLIDYAKNNNIPVYKRSEFLGLILRKFKETICVCGCHGKTTVSAMLTHVFMQSKYIPTSFIGGFDKTYKNFFFGEREICILEACEYKKNFLDFTPTTIVCTNIDFDHPDTFSSLSDTIDTFAEFTKNRRTAINSDDTNSVLIEKGSYITFGLKKGILKAKDIVESDIGIKFKVTLNSEELGDINLKIKGIFNVYNALACIAVALIYNIDFENIKNGLEEFGGVKRRMEYMGQLNGKSVYHDYAHHPKEIEQTLDSFCDKKTLVVFQPHTYSRTKKFMDDFVLSFKKAKKLIIYKTYPAREKFDIYGDASTLYKKIRKKKRVYYAENEGELKSIISKKGRNAKKIFFLGAGDIYQVVQKMI